MKYLLEQRANTKLTNSQGKTAYDFVTDAIKKATPVPRKDKDGKERSIPKPTKGSLRERLALVEKALN